MALSTTINFAMVDAKGKASNTKIRVPITFTIAQYVEFAQAFGDLLLAVSDGVITSITVSFALDLSGLSLKSVASGLCSVAVKAFGLFQTATGMIAKWLMPAPDEELVVAGSDDFNQATGSVAAVVSAFEDGIVVTGGTIQFTNGRGADITGISSLKETFRRR